MDCTRGLRLRARLLGGGRKRRRYLSQMTSRIDLKETAAEIRKAVICFFPNNDLERGQDSVYQRSAAARSIGGDQKESAVCHSCSVGHSSHANDTSTRELLTASKGNDNFKRELLSVDH